MRKDYQITSPAVYIIIALAVFLIIFIFFYLLFTFIVKRNQKKQIKLDEEKYLKKNINEEDQNEQK
ncbi:MAG: hypothetical protein HPPSJP_4120 [Candidatus Hepatoplasma scabrum]|nr:MAG: hypothetical protein HPPSJP_4120 [Candidatus Hepatoplasma sp.]